MGCSSSSEKAPEKENKKEEQVDMSHFNILQIIGKGASGTITAVEHKKTGRLMAMKKFSKEQLAVDRNLLDAVEQEKKIQQSFMDLKSPFLLNIEYSFNTDFDLVLITSFNIGGDLETSLWLRKLRFMGEADLRFYGAEMLMGLEALHSERIIHMDIKPSNVLISETGHTKLCDMGMSFILDKDSKGQICHKLLGTPGFEAPEVHKKGYCAEPCDIFSLGITWYALALAKLPFGAEPDYDNLRPLVFHPKKASSKWVPLSEEFIDLVTQMLAYKSEDRITLPEIMEHPWFTKVGFDWEACRSQQMKPPFVPEKDDWKKNTEFKSEDALAKLEARERRASVVVIPADVQAKFNDWNTTTTSLIRSTSHEKLSQDDAGVVNTKAALKVKQRRGSLPTLNSPAAKAIEAALDSSDKSAAFQKTIAALKAQKAQEARA